MIVALSFTSCCQRKSIFRVLNLDKNKTDLEDMNSDLSSTTLQAYRSVEVGLALDGFNSVAFAKRTSLLLGLLKRTNPAAISITIELQLYLPEIYSSLVQEAFTELRNHTATILAESDRLASKLSLSLVAVRTNRSRISEHCVPYLHHLASAMRSCCTSHLGLVIVDDLPEQQGFTEAMQSIVDAAGKVTSCELDLADSGILVHPKDLRSLSIRHWLWTRDEGRDWPSLRAVFCDQIATLTKLELECELGASPEESRPVTLPHLVTLSLTICSDDDFNNHGTHGSDVLFDIIGAPRLRYLTIEYKDSSLTPPPTLPDAYPRLKHLIITPGRYVSDSALERLSNLSERVRNHSVTLSLSLRWKDLDDAFPIEALCDLSDHVTDLNMDMLQLADIHCNIHVHCPDTRFPRLTTLSLDHAGADRFIPGVSLGTTYTARFCDNFMSLPRACRFPALEMLDLTRCLLPDAYAAEVAAILRNEELPKLAQVTVLRLQLPDGAKAKWLRYAQALEIGHE